LLHADGFQIQRRIVSAEKQENLIAALPAGCHHGCRMDKTVAPAAPPRASHNAHCIRSAAAAKKANPVKYASWLSPLTSTSNAGHLQAIKKWPGTSSESFRRTGTRLCWSCCRCEDRSPPPERSLDIRVLDVSRPAVVALAGIGRRP